MPSPPPTDTPSLRGRIVRGGAWLGAQYGLRQGLRFLRVVLVARLVAPGDIGLVGMAALAITLVRVLTETGLQQALIHRQDESRDTLDTAWTILLVRNLAIAALVAAGASLVARFFDEPRAADVVRVTSLVLVLDAFVNIAAVMFQKRLDFRRQALYLGGGEIVEFAVTVALAFALRNVWALVIGWVFGAAARVVFSYVAEPRMPRLCIDRAVLGELIGYGKWLTASSILGYVLLSGDKLVVGRFMGTDALGFYQIAFTVSNLPATAISHVIASVMFPAYAALRHDPVRLGRLYLRSLRITSLLSVPIAVLIAVLADVFVPVLLGEKWLPAVPLIQLLAVFGLLRSLGATTGAVFLAIGRPDIRTRIQIVQVVILAGAMIPLARYAGITGVAMSVALYAVVTNLYAVSLASRACHAAPSDVVEALLVPLSGGAITFGAVWWARSAFAGPSWLSMVTLALLGGIVYIGVVAAYDRSRRNTWRRDLVDVWSSARSGRQERAATMGEPPHPRRPRHQA